jgi:hypothetical protein
LPVSKLDTYLGMIGGVFFLKFFQSIPENQQKFSFLPLKNG